MKNKILILVAGISFGIINADYMAKVPLEQNTGGSLPNGSINFSNTIPVVPPTPTDLNDWTGCRYSAPGNTYGYYIRTVEHPSGYSSSYGGYAENGIYQYPATSDYLWDEYTTRRTILEQDGSPSGFFSTGTFTILRLAMTNSTDSIAYGQASNGDTFIHESGALMVDNGSEKYYEYCRRTITGSP